MATTNDAPGNTPAEPGLRSTLKILVPLVVLVGVVFGITLLMIYKPAETKDPTDGGDSQAVPGGQSPLRFFTTARHYDPRPVWGDDPVPVSLQDHYFPGYFERNTETKTAFWFENRHEKPVLVQLKGVSCTSCSGGSLAPIPPESVRDILQTFAVTSLPQGLVSALPIGMALPWADAVPKLKWQSHKFSEKDWTFTVPAAEGDKNPWSPTQWGILDLNFNTGGKSQLDALFASQVQDSKLYGEDRFSIAFHIVNTFDIIPTTLDVGEFDLGPGAKPVTRDFIVHSATRGPGSPFGDLPVPVCNIRMPGGVGEPGKLIAIGTPTPLTAAECARVAASLPVPGGSSGGGGKARVAGAYLVPVKITPEAGDDRLEIGMLEREVWVTVNVPGATERQVRVTGKVRGSVALSEGKEVALGSFKGEAGVTRSNIRITTDRPGMELAVVAGESRPDYLKATLKKLPDDPDRGYYELTVQVPPKRQFGSIQNGLVVLEIKGPKPQKIRIPVTGKGEF